ncbi:hypothetical protein PIIN_06391 [Serendipita indica DSM 11827]|uniref:DUF654-domain-containing protein n=1 Tax=Serendipita indica (strain DSM 11827) TaxID=1109443 RepID=G4TMB4_SERID|nr:hypothetical protein PIIN_06391 [Serendipita indica DSM 11827]
MPPRLSKRQQREQDEIAALATTSLEHQALASKALEDADSSKVTQKSTAAFSLMKLARNPTMTMKHQQRPRKRRNKKKKKKAATHVDNSAPPTPKPATTTASKASKAKKGKGKQEDDLDRALAELSLKYSDITIPDPSSAKTATPAVLTALHKLRALLAVQTKFLDADAEMRRFFGSKVISAADSSSSGSGQPRGPVARSVICKPQSSWPPAAMRDGLSMRPLTNEETHSVQTDNWMQMPGDKWFTVEHSPGYRWDQAQFIQIVGMLDPNNLFNLMRESFWHVDTLLQIGEVYRAQDDYSVSSDFTSRALFAYERSFSGAFSLTSGASRLDFRHVENRSLFLALHRTILSLERRGTMRTGFEFARMLWMLDPWTDPHGALMHLDFLSVKAEQYDWFMETEEAWEEARNEKTFLRPLEQYPGWLWSKALILKGMGAKRGGGEKKATEALKRAILAFPEVLATLVSTVSVVIPPGTTMATVLTRWNSSNGMNSAYSLLSQVYAHRSVSLWKIPETLAWLNSTIQDIHKEIRPQTFSSEKGPRVEAFIDSVLRHAIVSDMKPLAPFVGSLIASLGPQEPYDIVPPKGPGVTLYNDAYFASASAETARKRREGLAARAGGGGGRRRGQGDRIEVDPIEFLQMLEAVLTFEAGERREEILGALQQGPGQNVVRQLERWVRDHVEFAEQYPNARAYLLQPAAQRPRGAVNPNPRPAQVNPLLPVAGGVAGVGGAMGGAAVMPGGFVDDEMHEEDDEQDEESDEDGDAAPILPIRIARGLVNMFWGGQGPPEDAQDSENSDVD